jgi:hypothetical protein
MQTVLGAVVLAVSLSIVAVAVWVVRPRASRVAFVATLVVAGVGLGLGGLLCQSDVGVASWILTPIVLVVLTLAHTLSMIAGQGPLRT